MDRDMRDLENEVEAMLEPLAGRLDRLPRVGEAVIERVKAAVRHEINEQWLAAQPAVQPPTEVIAGVRTAVRDELRRKRSAASHRFSTHEGDPAARQRWAAGLAAAAMIAICAVLIQRVGTLGPAPISPGAMAANQPLDLFADAAEVALADNEMTGHRGPPRATVDNSDGVLDDLNNAVQDILSNPKPKDSTMNWPLLGPGALG